MARRLRDDPQDLTTVFDSSALLAILFQEPGQDVVADRLPGAVISTVNYAEVVTKLVEAQLSDSQVDAVLSSTEITIMPQDTDQAILTGRLRRPTRAAGLSLGDRACLALASSLDAAILTADRAWADLDLGLNIQVIR